MRYYHFGATLIAIGIAIWAVYGVREIQRTTETNLSMTHCNQGLLALATLDIWLEHQLGFCEPDVIEELRIQYP